MRIQRPQLGLRARVTLAFAGGALALSAALSGVSYGLVRNYLVDQTRDGRPAGGVRQRRRRRRDGLASRPGQHPPHPGLAPGPGRQPVAGLPRRARGSRPRSASAGRASPTPSAPAVNSGRPSRQTLHAWSGSTDWPIGLPLPGVQAELLRGLQPRPARPHAAVPRLRPPRRRPGHHRGRGGRRPVGQHPAPAARGRRGPGGGGRWPAAGSTPACPTSTTPTWPR